LPFLTVKIQPGVKTIATPTLLNANIVASNLIRWRGGLPEKYGGWMNFFTNLGPGGGPGAATLPGIVRDMCAWADLDTINHLALGGTNGLTALTPNAAGGPPTVGDIAPRYVLTTSTTAITTDGSTFSSYALDASPPGSMTITLAGNVAASVQVGWRVRCFGSSAGGPLGPTFAIPQGTVVTAIALAPPPGGGSDVTTITLSQPVAPGFPGVAGAPGPGVEQAAEIVFDSPATIITFTDPSMPSGFNTHCSIQVLNHVWLGDGQILLGTYPVQTVTQGSSGVFTIAAPPGWFYCATPAVLSLQLTNGVSGPPEGIGTFPYTLNIGGSGGYNIATVGIVPYQAGGTLAIAAPTTFGGVNFEGQFYAITALDVGQIIPMNTGRSFAFSLPNPPSANGNVNEGNLVSPQIAEIIYWLSEPPVGTAHNARGALGGNPYPPLYGSADYGARWVGGVTSDDWSLANFGSTLLSSPLNGPLFQWDPTAGVPNSAAIGGAPTTCAGFFVGMPEQQIIVYGASYDQVQDPLLVAWCDNANYNVWIANTDNQAGTFRLSRGSKIVGGIQGPQQAMLWTDVGLWVMSYIGYPDVFGFNEVAQGCGLIGKHAVAVYGPQVFWMGRDAFWVYANGAAQRLPCDVWDVIVKNLNNTRNTNGDYVYWGHIRGAANSDYDEVAWHFPSQAATDGENDSFVKFNTVTGEWDYSISTPQQGMVGNTPVRITEWTDHNIFGHPLSVMLGHTVITGVASIGGLAGATTFSLVGGLPAGVLVGMTIADLTNPAAITAGTQLSIVTTQVTLSLPLTANVPVGSLITFVAPSGYPSMTVATSAASASGSSVLIFTTNLAGLAVGWEVFAFAGAIATATTVSSFIASQITVSEPLAANVSAGDTIQFTGWNSSVMQHEMGMDANGSPINWMVQTGFFMLSDGEDKVFVDYMLPDFLWRRWQQPQSTSATVEITLYTADEPDDPTDPWIAYGPFVVTNASGGVEVRCRGRYFFALIQGNDLGSFVRLGGIKFRFAPNGRN
jgi:hypothetical protein